MSTERKSVSFKVIMLGDSGVGKTSLVMRQVRGQFSFVMAPTIGTSHMKTVIPINDYDVELKIWDTAGQEQFAPLVSMYARGANVCILVASYFDPTSLKNLELWQERLREANENPPFVVAVNKIDMAQAPMTIDQIREEYGEKYPNMFFVSAKAGDSVNELFACAAQEALKAMKEDENKNSNLDLEKSKEKKEGGCC